jgi:hypothetical protein
LIASLDWVQLPLLLVTMKQGGQARENDTGTVNSGNAVW